MLAKNCLSSLLLEFMKRNPEHVASSHYDLVVIGGGINGIATAYEAACRGLKTCLLEASDFMSQTSSNSLKIIHGGFRYLQQANLPRLRESSRERRTLLKIAPHIVQPLTCVLPTESLPSLRSRPGLCAGLAVNSLLTFDRSKGLPPDKQIPMGNILSKQELIELLGEEFARTAYTGAAIWHDGMAVNSERLGIAFLHSAVEHGLDALNYCPAVGFDLKNNKISGVRVQDALHGNEFTIAADFVINAAGAWAGKLLNLLPSLAKRELPQCRVMNVVSKRTLFPGRQAVGLFDHERAFFFVPWRGYWMIGTDEAAWQDEPEKLRVSEEEIEQFLRRINKVYPGAPLCRDEICLVHKGFVPGHPTPDGDFKLFDHQKEGLDNMLSLQPVKYTTARDIGQKSIDRYFRKTGKPLNASKTVNASKTAELPLAGGIMNSFTEFCQENLPLVMAETGLQEDAAKTLLCNYGTSYKKVLHYTDLMQPVTGSDEVLAAEIAYAVNEEMAVRLDDAVRRRTVLGSGEQPKAETLAACAALMGGLLNWSTERQKEEIARCAEFYL